MPLTRRLPKRGFHNPFARERAWVNIGQLEVFDAGAEVTPELMVQRGLLKKKNDRVKILADGVLTKSLTVKAHSFSAKAREKITSLGGKAEMITHA